ncbi:MAG: hypothetical protein ISQ06_01310 [Planctomycetaceae bacterium]|jgi:hypothetical protein|nr:hypothetical protein [Planctomycetaceae bacterium]MDA0920507.1 hypothetical protein [Planctomycetota bacterium]
MLKLSVVVASLLTLLRKWATDTSTSRGGRPIPINVDKAQAAAQQNITLSDDRFLARPASAAVLTTLRRFVNPL